MTQPALVRLSTERQHRIAWKLAHALACPTSNGQSTAGHSSEHRRASTGPDPGSMSRLRGRLR
eukprot:3021331-Prymnesium_polylepis.1